MCGPFKSLNSAGLGAINLFFVAKALPNPKVWAFISILVIFFYLKSTFAHLKNTDYYVPKFERTILHSLQNAPFYFIGITLLAALYVNFI
jgi:hypothetical protein